MVDFKGNTNEKTNMTKTRFIPEGTVEYKPEIAGYGKLGVAYVNLERKSAIFYAGKSSKPVFYNRFLTTEDMKKKINNTFSNLMTWEDRKAERKEARKDARKNMDVSNIKIGDIYHWSGGYNCTRNSYVKVVGIAGKNKFNAVKLTKYQVDGDWMNGNVAPNLDSAGDTVTLFARPACGGEEVILRDTKGYDSDYWLWNGKPNWENCD